MNTPLPPEPQAKRETRPEQHQRMLDDHRTAKRVRQALHRVRTIPTNRLP